MTNSVQSDHQEKPGARGRLWLATGVLLLLLPCLGLGGSVVYTRLWNEGALSRWRRLKLLPAGGVELVAGDTTTVYVRTAEGRLYGCRHRGGIEVPKNCWFEAQEPLELHLDARSEHPLYHGEVQPPAGTVVDRLDVTVRYAESASETRYVLMQDGAVFKWEADAGMFGSLNKLLCGPALGVVLGVAGTAILWASYGLRRRRKRGVDEGGQGTPLGG